MGRCRVSRAVRFLFVVTCFGLAAGCGGGGGGGPVPDPDILPLYRFAMGDTNSGAPFQVSFSDGGSDYAIVLGFPGVGLSGLWDFAADVTAIEAGARLDVDSDVGAALVGVFAVQVTADLPVTRDEAPPSGGLQVTAGAVTTTVVFHGATVDVAVGGAPPATYTFDEFADWFGAPAPTDLQRVSLAWAVLAYLIEQASLHLATFELLEADLEAVNPLVADCSTYGILTPPAGMPDPGSYTYLWNDVSGDGRAGHGDSFTWSFTDCWQDWASDETDLLWSGSIDYVNHTRVVTANTITRIGYEPSGADGGVFFDNTWQTETEVDTGAVLLRQARRLDGSYTFVLWAP